jgi:hypothetical protein
MMVMLTMQASRRQRFAELSSAVGAGVLGVGLGALLASPLRGLAIPILVAGLVLHSWGMTDKHQLENARGEARPRWSTALYWVCWLALGVLLVATIARALR